MKCLFLFLLFCKLIKSNREQNTDQDNIIFHSTQSNFNDKKKSINNLKKSFIYKTKNKDALPKILSDNNNTSNNNNSGKDEEENKNPTFFQRLVKVVSILFILFLVVAIVFAIVYIIIVKGGFQTNLSMHLNKIGISIGTDNEDSSNELDIKAILGEVRTSDSESMPIDENDDLHQSNDDYDHNNTENVQNNENINNINESS